MLDSQIKSLEEKSFREKTASQNDLARKAIQDNRTKDEKFDEWLKDQMK